MSRVNAPLQTLSGSRQRRRHITVTYGTLRHIQYVCNTHAVCTYSHSSACLGLAIDRFASSSKLSVVSGDIVVMTIV